MSRQFARKFYSSKAWKDTREAYKRSVGGVCERCESMGTYGVAGEIVHHKVHLTPENIKDKRIALAWDNLELVCRECHRAIHEAEFERKKEHTRYKVDANGRVVFEP